ncbi:MAG: hypothetical protein ACTSYR_02155 [Candidatus Odinarchaeia archaeon]
MSIKYGGIELGFGQIRASINYNISIVNIPRADRPYIWDNNYSGGKSYNITITTHINVNRNITEALNKLKQFRNDLPASGALEVNNITIFNYCVIQTVTFNELVGDYAQFSFTFVATN